MKASTRVVCNDCLRSVELTQDEDGPLSNVCPACSGRLRDSASESDSPAAAVDLTLPVPGGPAGDQWTETWSKGSLGTVGRFQLRELLGDGGFGQVYHAYDPRLDRDVALKVLRQVKPSERIMERFFREARAAARLAHPNIVGVFDAGSDAGRLWIAYEFIDGRPLSRFVDTGTMDIPGAVRIVRDLAAALDHAHACGIYHRDVKPANVVIDSAGGVHLIDFGLAGRADFESELTREGAILGTPAYIPPEQANGQSHLADERSDVFSVGVIFFELLCGRRPSELPSDVRSWQARAEGPPPQLRSLNSEVPAALERICMKALAADPADRYPTAAALVRELDRWLKAREGWAFLVHPLTHLAFGAAGALLLVGAAYALLGLFAAQIVRDAPGGDQAPTERPARAPRAAAAPALVTRTPAKAPATPSSPATPFVGNSESHTLHHANCYALPSPKRQVPLHDEAEAAARGFVKKCDKCFTASERRSDRPQG